MSEHHLDDEQLSAALDGQGEGDAAAHLRSCGPCAERLDALRRTAAALGEPVTPPAGELVDRAVQAAVARARPEPTTREPVPLHARRYLVPSLPWVAAAAAAIALLLGIAGLVRSSSDDVDLAQTSEGAGVEQAETAEEQGERLSRDAAGDAATSGSALSAGTGSATPYEDLGHHNDPDTLAAAVRARVEAIPQASSRQAEEQEAYHAAPCRAEAESVGRDRLAELVHVATAQWKQQPAFVLTFVLAERPEEEAATHQAYVMSSSRCSLLAEARF